MCVHCCCVWRRDVTAAQARQLIASGVLPVTEYPTFDADSGMGVLGGFEETEEELEIEVSALCLRTFVLLWQSHLGAEVI
jgi:hypothetical protein